MWLHHSSLAWRWKKEPPAKIHCPQWPCPPDHLRNPAACEKNIQEISNSQNANFNIFRVGMKMQQWVIYSITWYSRRWYIVSLVIFVKIYLFKNDTGHRSLGPGGGAWILRFPQVVSQPTKTRLGRRWYLSSLEVLCVFFVEPFPRPICASRISEPEMKDVTKGNRVWLEQQIASL